MLASQLNFIIDVENALLGTVTSMYQMQTVVFRNTQEFGPLSYESTCLTFEKCCWHKKDKKKHRSIL